MGSMIATKSWTLLTVHRKDTRLPLFVNARFTLEITPVTGTSLWGFIKHLRFIYFFISEDKLKAFFSLTLEMERMEQPSGQVDQSGAQTAGGKAFLILGLCKSSPRPAPERTQDFCQNERRCS